MSEAQLRAGVSWMPPTLPTFSCLPHQLPCLGMPQAVTLSLSCADLNCPLTPTLSQDGCNLAVVLWGEPPSDTIQASHPRELSVLAYDELLAKVGWWMHSLVAPHFLCACAHLRP